jgi:hypothetical protein
MMAIPSVREQSLKDPTIEIQETTERAMQKRMMLSLVKGT